jgi:hypothetical protein
VDRAEWLLVLLLRVSAGILLLAAPCALLPFDWMDATHQALGLGKLPDRPILGYLTRSLSALYAGHGLQLLYLSFNVRRYLPFVRFLLVISVLFGVVLFAIDLTAGLPGFWTWTEGPSLVVFYGLLLWLSSKTAGERPA